MVSSAKTRRGRRRVEISRAVVYVGLGVLVVMFGVFLAGQGLDEADKWASVLGLFLNVFGVLAAVAGLSLVWENRRPERPDVASGLETEPLRQSDPRRVGGFRLLGRLGSGATGVVYLGRTAGGTFGAVKVVRSDLADDKVFRRRFEHEVRCVERLPGRRFPRLLASDVTAERPWLATEYEPGMPLGDAVDDGGPWDLATVGWLAAGLAEALREIHAQDIVHRDLTPWNILVSEDGPMVVDFGIARAGNDTRLTRTGAPMGTVAFMSPEQANGDELVGPAADVFALGSLLVFAANGEPPFGDESADTVLSRIRLRKPNLGGLAGSRHPVVALIRACLNKNPTERPSPAEIVLTCQPYADRPVADLLPAAVRERIAAQRAAIGPRTRRPGPEDAGTELRRPPKVPWRLAGSRRVKAAVAIAVAVVVGAATWIVWWPQDWKSTLVACTGAADTTLRVASSADKSDLLQRMAAAYGQRQADGHCVRVVVDERNSGATMDSLARGWTAADGDRPDVWSPASREWLHMARHRATGAAADALPASETASIVTTPLVIAMPRPMAEKLGWPDNREIGWRKLAELATDEDGWGRYGAPEWGAFRLGKTNPKFSTSGLNATIGAFQASREEGPDQQRKLESGDVADQEAQQLVSNIEQSIAHYGETTLHFLANLRHAADEDRALSYVSAVTVEESSMLAYNAGYPSGTSTSERTTEPSTKLAAIYPAEGTIYSDHPYVELSWPDTDAAKRAVSADFLRYLHSVPVQDQFQDYGFRDHNGRPGPLATRDNGAIPDAVITELPLPDPPVIDQVLAAWTGLRKPANVLLVMDVSASMEEGVTHKDPRQQECAPEQKVSDPPRCPTKLERVKEAKQAIVDEFTDKEKVGLWEFSVDLDGDTDYRPLVPVQELTEAHEQQLLQAIDGLQPRTDTGLYNTISAAVATMRANIDKNTINAVVVLTDGRDNGFGMKLDPLLDQLRTTDQDPVRVFTIAYGFGSDEDRNGQLVLQQIADASGGARYEAKDSQRIIQELVAAVVSNF